MWMKMPSGWNTGSDVLRRSGWQPSKTSAAHGMAKITLQKDFQEFLSLLIRNEVRFLVVGGYASASMGIRVSRAIWIFLWRSPRKMRNGS